MFPQIKHKQELVPGQNYLVYFPNGWIGVAVWNSCDKFNFEDMIMEVEYEDSFKVFVLPKFEEKVWG